MATQTPEQRIADDLGISLADLERIAAAARRQRERARERARAAYTLPGIGIDVEYTNGRVEAGRDKYGIPYLRNTQTGAIVSGSRAIYRTEDLTRCADDWAGSMAD